MPRQQTTAVLRVHALDGTPLGIAYATTDPDVERARDELKKFLRREIDRGRWGTPRECAAARKGFTVEVISRAEARAVKVNPHAEYAGVRYRTAAR